MRPGDDATRLRAADIGDFATLDVELRTLDEVDAGVAPLAVDREALQRDDDKRSVDDDAILPGKHGNTRIYAGGRRDRHRLGDRDRAITARIERDDLTACGHRGDGGTEPAAG